MPKSNRGPCSLLDSVKISFPRGGVERRDRGSSGGASRRLSRATERPYDVMGRWDNHRREGGRGREQEGLDAAQQVGA